MTRIFAAAVLALIPIAVSAHTGPDLTQASFVGDTAISLALNAGAAHPPLQIVCPLPGQEAAPTTVVSLTCVFN